MPSYLARIDVMLKPLVNDPQGSRVADGLRNLGFDSVNEVRVGKRIEVTLEAADSRPPRPPPARCASRLLANPVIEDFASR